MTAKSTTQIRRPVVLIVRDGWGANPYPQWNHANAVYLARKPVDDHLMATYPHVLIHTSGNNVGLPDGVMGNSEVGHQNIGAGRVVEQELMRITGRIHDGSFFENRVIAEAFSRAQENGGFIHVMGLCSDGRVHSDLEHLFAILEFAKRRRFPGERLLIHAFTDGRDTPPRNGLQYLRAVHEQCLTLGVGRIATIVGRYYAMDRDNRWDRIERAYRLLVNGEGREFGDPLEAVEDYYDRPEPGREGDEFIAPRVIRKRASERTNIRSGDSVIFFNFRGDRPRQLTKAFVLDEFPRVMPDGMRMGFERGPKLDLYFATMTAYESGLPVHVIYDKPPKMRNILGAHLSNLGLHQFRCAETEKYAHVTFFFNDYRDEPFPEEERLLVPSPRDVATYDLKPQMSAYELTDALIERLHSAMDDCVVINYANGDMVGHTGNLRAAVRAVETVDECVGRVVNAVLAAGGALIVTADHGNCEQMIDPATGGPHTSHTTYDVELIVVDDHRRGAVLREGGRLADIAPTILDLMGLEKPVEMSGLCLL